MTQDPYGNFTWRITEFTRRQSETKIYSDVFTVGGWNWRILVFPKGNNNRDHLSMYLDVADSDSLPFGWRINANFSLTVVNQIQRNSSIKNEAQPELTAQQIGWGFRTFMRLTELHDSSKGYLVNNTVVVEAEVLIPDRVDTFFSNLEKLILDATDQGQNCAPKAGSSLTCGLKSEAPSLEEVELAKKSLKECLSDLFKLNMIDRLSTSLETLSRAKIGVSSEEQRAVELFWGEFDDFVSDFLTFEQDNSELELQKIKRDQMFSSIKKNHEIYISSKQLIVDLTKEEEEHKKKMEEAKSKKVKLMSDCQALTASTVETKTKYTAQLKKLEEAEEKKRIAEERMSRSTSAWSSLKAHFV